LASAVRRQLLLDLERSRETMEGRRPPRRRRPDRPAGPLPKAAAPSVPSPGKSDHPQRRFVGARPATPARSRTMRLSCLTLLAALALVAPVPPAHAGKGGKRQLVVFKDGFIVRGVIKRPEIFDFDPASGAHFRVPVAGGFFYIDDDVRTIAFAHSALHNLV